MSTQQQSLVEQDMLDRLPLCLQRYIMMLHILEFKSPTLGALACVSRAWNVIAKDHVVWNDACRCVVGNIAAEDNMDKEHMYRLWDEWHVALDPDMVDGICALDSAHFLTWTRHGHLRLFHANGACITSKNKNCFVREVHCTSGVVYVVSSPAQFVAPAIANPSSVHMWNVDSGEWALWFHSEYRLTAVSAVPSHGVAIAYKGTLELWSGGQRYVWSTSGFKELNFIAATSTAVACVCCHESQQTWPIVHTYDSATGAWLAVLGNSSAPTDALRVVGDYFLLSCRIVNSDDERLSTWTPQGRLVKESLHGDLLNYMPCGPCHYATLCHTTAQRMKVYDLLTHEHVHVAYSREFEYFYTCALSQYIVVAGLPMRVVRL